MAKPVIASAEAAEGISARLGEELLVAAGEDEFVSTIHMLLGDGNGTAIGRAGRERVLADYSWDANLGRIEDLVSATPVNVHRETPIGVESSADKSERGVHHEA